MLYNLIMELNEYLTQSKAIVEKRINEFIRKKKFAHKLLKKSMLYSINAGGKRIRPALMFLVYEMLCGKDKKNIVDAAAAIEMVHTYSLIHDDLPAMDNDDLRRGKPTNHKVFGEGIAILAGDGLLTDAFNIIASSRDIKENLKAKVIEILSYHSGSSGMVSGQVEDLLSEGKFRKKSEKKSLKKIIDYIHLHKTADMIMAGCEIGCILSEKYSQFNNISDFGKKIGLAFQITDDILDIIGNKKKLGKMGSDLKNQKLTYVSLFGIEESQKIAERLFNSAINSLEKIVLNNIYKQLLKDLAFLIIRRDK
ncbi:MAG: polyprenyl synthetase family protein [Elusimicrobiota bacterium]